MRFLQCLGQRGGLQKETSDGKRSVKPISGRNFSRQRQHDAAVLLGRESFRQVLKDDGQALTKSDPRRSGAMIAREVGASKTLQLQSEVAAVERHVSFREDMQSAWFAAQRRPAQHAAARHQGKFVPLRSALRRSSKFASATPEMELMVSLCLPLLTALIWLWCGQ